jgi:hypothetical protein
MSVRFCIRHFMRSEPPFLIPDSPAFFLTFYRKAAILL